MENFIELLDNFGTPEYHYSLDFSSNKLEGLYDVKDPSEITSLNLSRNNLDSIPECVKDFIN
jgi:Leucine-rich repeat (LRR) protein